MEEKEPSKDPRRRRNPEGMVIVHERNAQTSPMKKVDRTYFKFPKYI